MNCSIRPCLSLLKHPHYPQLFCPACSAPASISYFDLFLQPPQFELNLSSLKKTYRDFQMQLHPDKLQSKGHTSQDYSKLLSEAYATLTNEVTRAQHLVRYT
mmetsp:Transcript_5860/g.10438  ORF Transcript_5860/g.10438 Transcript_5860/m.10438 type:complete len:102 (-) Transcript_5860:278-583(-)